MLTTKRSRLKYWERQLKRFALLNSDVDYFSIQGGVSAPPAAKAILRKPITRSEYLERVAIEKRHDKEAKGIMRFDVQEDFEPVPSGSYRCRFLGCFDFQSAEESPYKRANVRLVWRIIGGSYDGREVDRICNKHFSRNSLLYKFACALNGDAIDESFDFDDYSNVYGQIILEDHNDRTRPLAFVREQ